MQTINTFGKDRRGVSWPTNGLTAQTSNNATPQHQHTRWRREEDDTLGGLLPRCNIHPLGKSNAEGCLFIEIISLWGPSFWSQLS